MAAGIMEPMDKQEARIRLWLDAFTARNMAEGNEYGGPVPLEQWPPEITGTIPAGLLQEGQVMRVKTGGQ